MKCAELFLFVAVAAISIAGSLANKTVVSTESGQDVKNEPKDICKLPPMDPTEVKSCLAFIIKYTYNATEGKCMTYVYGGCGGSANLFNSEADCLAACPRKETSQDAPEESSASDEKKPIKDRKEICSQSLEGGPCYAAIKQFGFNTETGRCEWFVYGGCEGNDNKFFDAKSCQETCGGSEPLTDFDCDKTKCDWNMWGHYKAKNCKPVYERGECCPTRFECPELAPANPEQPVCRYKGKVYQVNEEMTEVTANEPCLAACRCSLLDETLGTTKINCANVECPDLFRPTLAPGCRRLYDSLKNCCSTSTQCNITESDILCEFEGRQYVDGERIYPRDRTKTCMCNSDFVESGVDSKACKSVACGWESVYHDRLEKGCTPVYFNQGTCPIDWVCPGDKGQKVDSINFANEKALARAAQQEPTEQATANNVCLQPKQAGPCEALVPSFYYNSFTGKCEEFDYGGCQGNSNRFNTSEECEAACQGSPNGCTLAPERGRCRGRIAAWHFDTASGSCKSFFYGGCGGNQNNFISKETCEGTCAKGPVAKSPPANDDPTSGSDGKPLQCHLGQDVFSLGAGFLPESNKCYECRCSTPPELNCREISHTCPPSPGPEYSPKWTVGKCCPTYAKGEN